MDKVKQLLKKKEEIEREIEKIKNERERWGEKWRSGVSASWYFYDRDRRRINTLEFELKKIRRAIEIEKRKKKGMDMER